MINKFFFTFFVIFCFADNVHAKELPSLFTVNIAADQYTNTNDGLNKAFNQLLKKLSGSRNKRYLWRVGDAKLNKIDFVSSYSVEAIDGNEYLSVEFNRATLIPELRKINMPLIGYSRPVILFLIKIDSGEGAPSYMDLNNPADSLQTNIQTTLNEIASDRGVYLELPAFDLEDQNFLQQTNILFSPAQYIQEKFYNDELLSFEISRIGINQWLINGDLNSQLSIQEDMILDFFREQIHLFLDSFLSVEPLEQGAAGDRLIISITGLESFEDVQAVELELDKIFAIKSRDFHFFDRANIEYQAQLFQTTDALLKELRGSTKLYVKELAQDSATIYLEYLN
ncbi:DUF2066 domain-containing protein [bacterium]|nr:DUF2066 domain-containing protein [bacterium]MDA9023674.1 DUF2066 domain-containing protein [Gammaproteobacteria bacterium]MDA9834879.1 DUF2066 domain-containing protein [Gammaproteobacteria bacterium]MDA9979034.1 DUF2066 domain-containing protein [Gammaproteobacteria bacterium]MDC3372215.1 DUF2066 domain-containing protein [Gammaproteobacteria bacterium]